MDQWEFAMVGYYVDNRAEFFFRFFGSPPERLPDQDSMFNFCASLGREGWELVSSTVSSMNGETWYFKRRLS